MRMAAALALLACAPLLPWPVCTPAQAAVLYRCNGDSGEIVFASHVGHYRGCKVISGIEARAPRETRTSKSLMDATSSAPQPTAVPAAANEPAKPEPIPVMHVPITDAPAPDPSVIAITPLRDAGEPIVRELPSGMTALPVAKPWPITVLEALATDLLPRLLQPRIAPARNAPTPMVVPASAPPTPIAAIPAAFTRQAPVASTTPRVTISRGAVYRIAHADGSVEYTNVAARAQGAHAKMLFAYIMRTCVACNVHSTIDWNSAPLHLDAYNDDIRLASAQTGVDEALLRAVIHAESNFNPAALSIKGAQGLMQLMPGTANDLGVGNPFDVGQNIRGGARYLSQLLKVFNGNITLAAAAYNSGADAVRKYGGVPPYDETQVYVKRVALLRDRYLQALRPPAFAAAGSPR